MVFLGEMVIAVHKALKKAETSDDRRLMTDRLFDFVNFLERLQCMPLVVRLNYFGAAFAVYNFLRRNKQLGRREGGFDAEVKYEIVRALKKIADEY